jgi:predicted metal-binding membrane protein
LWVAAIAILVLLEKIVPWGARIARLSGTVMLGFAVFQLVMG